MKITSQFLRDKYLNFFKESGHAVIKSASLIPENDPSVLFTTAGMHPLVPYLLGEKHPGGKRLTDIQKCVRTEDIDEVGDDTHCTFFEMLGNWSLGDYFKRESISMSFDFLTNYLHIPSERLAVTVFEGDEWAPADMEAEEIWRSFGLKNDQIFRYGRDNNWWGPAGQTGPCGPDTEIFYDMGKPKCGPSCGPSCNCGKYVEIWNNVFMEYRKNADGTIEELEQKNVDTGMGLERVVAVLESVDDNYKTSIWKEIIEAIESVSKKTYNENEVSMRIIADHIRTAVFISADYAGIKPSNTDQGYILRRLIRRAIRHGKKLGIDTNTNWMLPIALEVIAKYEDYYSEIKDNKEIVLEVLKNESVKFNRTLEKGLKEFDKLISHIDNSIIDKENAFRLYDTYGFPIELTEEMAQEKGLTVDIQGFYEKFKAHQDLSRTASVGKFKGGLASSGEMETKYHTATHLLNAALKVVVDKNVHQKGSNITEERMRCDFSCDHKLTDEEKKQVEELVNKWIQEDLPVTMETMNKNDAVNSGAEAMFIEKYADIVNVYSIGEVSKEICGGPHVEHTGVLGVFRIKKEEASSAGVRRIKAVLE